MGSREDFASHFNVSRETMEKFDIYERNLRIWAPKINLISLKTIDDIWSRHFADSAEIFRFLGSKDFSYLDMGTGAGFPGLVTAILMSEKCIELPNICLVDENYKRVSFLRQVARECGVTLDIKCSKIELVEPTSFDVITARAFAPLEKLLGYSYPYAQKGARLIFAKGREVNKEIEVARMNWNFEYSIYNLESEFSGCLLEISELKRA